VIIQHFRNAPTSFRGGWPIEKTLSGISVLYGDPGTGKSFVALSMAVAVATGRPWIGRDTREGPVVYIAGEGGRETVIRRLGAAIRVWGIDPHPDPDTEWFDPRDAEDVPIWIVTPGPDLVAGHEPLKVLIGDIAPKLVIVDTLSRCFIGDENKQEDMGKFVRSLDRLRDAYGEGAAILVIHHTNTHKKIRGSTVLQGAVDVLWKLTKAGGAVGEQQVLMTAEKLRERGTEDAQVRLRLCTVAARTTEGGLLLDEVGDSLTTLVVKPSRALLEHTEALRDVGLALIAAGGSVKYADWRKALSQRSKAEFDAALGMILTGPRGLGAITQSSPGVFRAVTEAEVAAAYFGDAAEESA
jgi:hypothetical protein